MIKQISIKTRFGWISAFESKGKIFKIKFGRLKVQKKTKTLTSFKKQLLRLLSSRITKIKVPHVMAGNTIQRKIWSDLKKIKIGTTKTYGNIAKKYKLSPRYVGKICGQNKLLLIVPCHRVIMSNGSLGGFSSSGGIKLKKKLLKFEGAFI